MRVPGPYEDRGDAGRYGEREPDEQPIPQPATETARRRGIEGAKELGRVLGPIVGGLGDASPHQLRHPFAGKHLVRQHPPGVDVHPVIHGFFAGHLLRSHVGGRA